MLDLAHWLHQTPMHPHLSRAPADKSAGAARAARLLIVEDDYFVALELEQQLLDAGFDVVGVAVTAEDALAKAVAGRPELAVMDVRLAGARDGVDAAIELAKLGIPSIFATAHNDPHTRLRAEQAKPAGWLQKPYPSHALIALIRAALASRR